MVRVSGWDDWRERVTDRQPAQEGRTYIKLPDLVEEYLIRDDDGHVLGRLSIRQLIHPERLFLEAWIHE